LGAALGLAEEGSALVGIVPKLMAEDAKSALGIAETASHIDGGLLFDEEGAESFILALQWKLWRKEEMSARRSRYLIDSAGRHTTIMLPKHSNVNMFIKTRVD
jgi:peroxiredoxin